MSLNISQCSEKSTELRLKGGAWSVQYMGFIVYCSDCLSTPSKAEKVLEFLSKALMISASVCKFD